MWLIDVACGYVDKCSQVNQVKGKIGAVRRFCNQANADAGVNRTGLLWYESGAAPPARSTVQGWRRATFRPQLVGGAAP